MKTMRIRSLKAHWWIYFGIVMLSTLFVACGSDKKDNDAAGTDEPDDTGDTADTDEDTGDSEEGTDSDSEEISESGINVAANDARACDVLLSAADGTRITDVSYKDGVLGKVQLRAPNAGLSFIATEDASFSGSVASVSISGPSGTGAPEIVSAVCYDNVGKKIAESGVTLD